MHDAALKYGKYYGNAGAQYLTGYTVSADTRMVQNGPACDGWRPAGRGRGREAGPEEEPVIGLPTGRAGSSAGPPDASPGPGVLLAIGHRTARRPAGHPVWGRTWNRSHSKIRGQLSEGVVMR